MKQLRVGWDLDETLWNIWNEKMFMRAGTRNVSSVLENIIYALQLMSKNDMTSYIWNKSVTFLYAVVHDVYIPLIEKAKI